MPRRSKMPGQINPPHPWAFLVLWRDATGLTQSQVAEHFAVSDVTIHRWETGRSPVTGPAYFKLAKIYRARSPASLYWPPNAEAEAAAVESAHRIIQGLSEERLRQWLDLGSALMNGHGPSQEGDGRK